MKTKFKISIVIASFVVFYLALIPALQICNDSGVGCTVWRELVLFTRPVIVSSEGIVWSGSVEGIDSPTFTTMLVYNIPFLVSMIMLPLAAIGLVMVWDKKK